MIKLTDRLQVIANEIEQNETMADIGTDHGFLPIYLWEQGICPKVIMADISPGSLDKARNLAQALYPEESFDIRLGNGIQILDSGEVDVLVLAGMGGGLMCEILADNLEKTKRFKRLILQPRTGQGKLRQWLIETGFEIPRETLVREGKYICEIIVAELNREGMPERLSSEIAYEVPPWIRNTGPLSIPFIERKKKTEEKILAGLLKSNIPQEEKIQRTKDRIRYLEHLLGEREYGNEIKNTDKGD